MTRRTSRSRPPAGARPALAGLAGLVVALAGCSAAGDPSLAASVDGREVAVDDVQTAVAELPLEITGGARVQPADVVSLLVVAPLVTDVARQFDAVTSTQQAEEFLHGIDDDAGRAPGDYADATLDVVAVNLMVQALQESPEAAPLLQQAAADLEQADVVINPRYGSVSDEGQLLFGDFARDWLVPTEA